MDTGRKILNLRCDRKITQQDLARACGITPSALSKIESGINSPRASIIWRIARQLGVTVEYLLDESLPYPYAGYTYRQEFYARNEDPQDTVKVNLTREEKAFLDALRASNRVAREIAMAIPETGVEVLRMIHFLIHHARVQQPSAETLQRMQDVLTMPGADGAGGKGRRRVAAGNAG
jgi:transcriptional regulator with XRE-family HTH domain